MEYDTLFFIEFHWHMELFFEAVMKSLCTCTVLAVTEVFNAHNHTFLAMWLQLWLRPEIAKLYQLVLAFTFCNSFDFCEFVCVHRKGSLDIAWWQR